RAAEEIAAHGKKQPEPYDEHEDRKNIRQKIGKAETSIKEHNDLLCFLLCYLLCYLASFLGE
ncbi:MAG: hypothetical protein WBE32_10920, partial [Pseudolabrys sp.]